MSPPRPVHVCVLFVIAIVGFSHAHAACLGDSSASLVVTSSPGDLFTADGSRATTAWLTNTPGVDPAAVPDAPMLRALAGVRREIALRDLGQLRRSAKTADLSADDADLLGYLVLIRDGARSALSIFAPRSTPDQILFAAQAAPGASDEPPAAVQMPRARAEAALGPLAPIEPDADSMLPQGEIVDLPGPYAQSEIRLTSREIRARLQPPKYRQYPSSGETRSLDNEHMWIRLPADRDANRPAGLVVWISPRPDWRIPPQYAEILDELGFIAVGVDQTGNTRQIIDRMQLQLDAVATVSARYPIDQERVYFTGFSGGGYTSTILLGLYPEHFAGALPIVGLSSYHEYEQPDGRIRAAFYKRPKGDQQSLARKRRIFSISGTEDFNLQEMRDRTERFVNDTVPARLEVVEGMRHEQMPPAELIAEGLRWIDEPRRSNLDEREITARDQLAAITAQLGGEPPSDRQREMLAEVCRTAPWGESAWRAAALLGYERP